MDDRIFVDQDAVRSRVVNQALVHDRPFRMLAERPTEYVHASAVGERPRRTHRVLCCMATDRWRGEFSRFKSRVTLTHEYVVNDQGDVPSRILFCILHF